MSKKIMSEKNVNIPEYPVSRKEQYLNKIAGNSGELPDYPVSRIERYLAYIAEHGGGGGEGAVNSVNGKTGNVILKAADIKDTNNNTIQKDLNSINATITQINNDIAAITPTLTQLEAMNSGINASLVARTILTPVSSPTAKTLLGVNETNAEVQFRLGTGLKTDETTSPYNIDVKGITLLTTAPTSDNPDSDLKIVALSAEPTAKYNGYLYLITEA